MLQEAHGLRDVLYRLQTDNHIKRGLITKDLVQVNRIADYILNAFVGKYRTSRFNGLACDINPDYLRRTPLCHQMTTEPLSARDIEHAHALYLLTDKQVSRQMLRSQLRIIRRCPIIETNSL